MLCTTLTGTEHFVGMAGQGASGGLAVGLYGKRTTHICWLEEVVPEASVSFTNTPLEASSNPAIYEYFVPHCILMGG